MARIAPGTSSTTTALQTIDYDYHLRGWLTGINAPNGVASLNTAQNDLFALSLQYEADGKYFDGNLRKQLWISNPVANSGKIVAKQFTYDYNHANRLTQAQYVGGKENFSLDKAEYDANGNVNYLWQNGWLGSSNFGRMDQLTFNFTHAAGNKLTHVSDAITNNTDAGDFRDRNTATNDYEYWPNGDLKKDLNKDITLIDYNFLRLPKKLTLTASRWIEYHYSANGQKLRKQSSTGEVWDYVGEFVYKNSSIYQITHEEGRITNGKYEYNYTDHLGNLRLRFRDSLTAGAPPVITQENHYSPFGLSLKGVDFQNTAPDNFKYSQNEQQTDFGVNLYDFGARFSDPTTGNRFLQQDPLAEISRRFSPYIYANSNPMRFIDPDGMSSQDVGTQRLSDGTTVSYDVNTQKTLGYDTEAQGEGDEQKKEKPTPKINLPKPTIADPKPSDPIIQAGLGLSTALALDDATGIGVVDDPLIPVILAGTAIYAAVTTDWAQKMADEIDRIAKKATGPQGSVYELRVRKAGTYPDVRGNLVTLKAGDIWKYGETTIGKQRYSDTKLENMIPGGVTRKDIYFGNQIEIKIFEKYLIYGYFFNHGTLPPGNKYFR